MVRERTKYPDTETKCAGAPTRWTISGVFRNFPERYGMFTITKGLIAIHHADLRGPGIRLP